MYVFRNIDLIDSYIPYCVTIGNFDGLHLGHQEIIKTCINTAISTASKSLAIIFEPHPATVLNSYKGAMHRFLATTQQKLQALKELGLYATLIINFNDQIANIQSIDFIEKLLLPHINIQYLIAGRNFLFGRKGKGNVQLINELAKKHSFQFQAINTIYREGMAISSSRIRETLNAGAVGLTALFLGRAYSIEGIVTKGQGIAYTKLGLHTANINLADLENNILPPTQKIHEFASKQYPAYGVYAVRVLHATFKYYGIAYLGSRPTLHNNPIIPVLEVHILDFNQDICGAHVLIEFLKFIRPEKKFSELSILKDQIKSDICNTQYTLQNDISLKWLCI